MLGYYLVSGERIINKILSLRWFLVGGWIIASTINILLFVYIEKYQIINTVCNYLAFSFGIPALFCLAHEYLDFSNSISKKSKSVYIGFFVRIFFVAGKLDDLFETKRKFADYTHHFKGAVVEDDGDLA